LCGEEHAADADAGWGVVCADSGLSAGRMFQRMYHGVSAMAMKGLKDMGDSFSAKGDETFSQLPTQQY